MKEGSQMIKFTKMHGLGNDYVYIENDEYPRKDINIDNIAPERIEELSTTKNKNKKIYIKDVENEKIEEKKVKKKKVNGV